VAKIDFDDIVIAVVRGTRYSGMSDFPLRRPRQESFHYFFQAVRCHEGKVDAT
jgi:hypothetical protein